jgi:hypothetical protein
MSAEHFGKIVVADFEYESRDGPSGDIYPLPQPLCLVTYLLDENLNRVRTIKLWREQLLASKHPPFDIGHDTLFVAYSAWAELTCFLALAWQFPAHVFDLHTCFLAGSNILPPHTDDDVRAKRGKKLPDACRAYDIHGWENLDKGSIARDIGEGRWRMHGQEKVFEYCEEDVRKSTELLRKQIGGHGRFQRASVPHVLLWSDYSAKAIARVQARGIPIDTYLWHLIQEHRVATIRELLRRFDPSHNDDEPIYDSEGMWSTARFAKWIARNRVPAWPRLASDRLDLGSDAFRLMSHGPGIRNLHILRDSIGFIAKASMPVATDGRNHPSLFPFGTATGRNAHGKSIFNAHAGMRSLIVFRPDKLGVYLDWKAQEMGIFADFSGDENLRNGYQSGDIYHDFAITVGLTSDPDPKRWKATHPDQRERMKSLGLGIGYGMGVASLAKGLNCHPVIASGFIELHRRKYSKAWDWRRRRVDAAFLQRRMESVFGWPLHLSTSPNERTLYNFPMQAGGAEMMRLATCRLCDAGLTPCMLVHDGILFELDNAEQIAHAKEIMAKAAREVCPSLEIGVDLEQDLHGGQRYVDKREDGKKLWATLMDVLESIGALPKRA